MYRKDIIESIGLALSTKCPFLDHDVSLIIAEQYIYLREKQSLIDAKSYHLNREWLSQIPACTEISKKKGTHIINKNKEDILPTTLNIISQLPCGDQHRRQDRPPGSMSTKLKEYEGVFNYMSSKRGIRGTPYWNISTGIWGIQNHLSTEKTSMKDKQEDLKKIPIHIIRYFPNSGNWTALQY
jgi:hypothetical protein